MALVSSEQLTKLKHKASELVNRSLDQHVTLAVTGLSRSGKTAFITSLVNQLLNDGAHSHLSFFTPVHQGRFIAAKRVPQKHFHISRFDYDQAMDAFCQQPPHWPEPTKGISEIRLAIKYKPKDSLLKYATDMTTLTLDITDYPGEWLLDLPMLSQTYEVWSEKMMALMSQEPRVSHASAFIDKVNNIDPFAEANEQVLSELAQEYTALLHKYRDELGLSVIQPGRFILPGELAGAPILEFFPYSGFANLEMNQYQNASDTSFVGMLRARFLEYRERVVKKFYKQHFLTFDRQIVLADCLTPLNKGVENFNDLQLAITMILESYNYGQSSLFSRLFSPQIDRLLFAATKADHVTPEQHPNLVSLVNQLIHQTKSQLSFDAINMKTMAIASVKTTQVGQSQHRGRSIPVLKGRSLDDDNTITVFPGSVPNKLPTADFWQQDNGFSFIDFCPQQSIDKSETLPHLRLDQVLEFLLGDKMK